MHMHLCILDGSHLLPSEYDEKEYQKFMFLILLWRELKTMGVWQYRNVLDDWGYYIVEG